MKAPIPFIRNLQGTILIFSLIVILGGTLVLAGWAQMMATRATYTTTTEEGQKRRIAIANGRALARQYVLNQMPSGTIGSALQGTNFSLADGWGGFAINFASGVWSNTNFVEGNPFNPISGPSFVVTNLGTISNSAEALNWTYLIRSRSPVLSGYPIVVQNPATTNLAWVAANAKKIFWSEVIGFSNSPAIPFTSGTNSSGFGTNGYIGYFASPLSTNYVYSPATVTYPTNTFSTNTAVFVPPPVTNGGTITRNFDGGTMTANVSASQPAAIVRYDIPNAFTNLFAFTNTVTNVNIATNSSIVTNSTTYITGTNYTWNAKHTRITGTNYTYGTNYTTATNYTYTTNYATNTYIDRFTNSSATNVTIAASAETNALHIIIPASNTNLTQITLSGATNTRMVYVNHAGANLTLQTATTNENYTWRMGITVATFPSSFAVRAPTGSRSLTIQGGIRSVRNIDVNQGNLVLSTNTSPAMSGSNASSAELITDRIIWLEEQRTP